MFIKRIERFLKQGRVYIVPTKNGFIFLAMTLFSTVVGVVYSNNTILLISFLLFSLFLLHMFYTNFNISGLKIDSLKLSDAHVGENFKLELVILNKGRNLYQSLSLDMIFQDDSKITLPIHELPSTDRAYLQLPFSIKNRGHYKVNKVILWSKFPMGLFYAWSPLNVNQSFYAYPFAEGIGLNDTLIAKMQSDDSDEHTSPGAVEFLEHRKYKQGDPVNKIDWKLYARKNHLYTRHFAEGDTRYYHFHLNEQKDLETELSQLALWIKQVSQTNHMWSLKLGTYQLPSNRGKEHQKEAMKELSLYES